MTREHFFLKTPGTQGQRFCIYHPAERQTNKKILGIILYIHPFADEMNKSRPMAARQARAFAEAGFSVLQIDLLGCGDSSGEFEDATWADWLKDILNAHQWLVKRQPPDQEEKIPLWLWGIRMGCLLASEAAKLIDCNLIFWQPSTSGQIEMKQFLRLRLTENVLGNNTEKVISKEINSQTNVLGYSISKGLIDSISSLDLKPNLANLLCKKVIWFEVKKNKSLELSPQSVLDICAWKNNGIQTYDYCIEGHAFWYSSEIVISKELIDKTTCTLLEISQN